MVQTLIKTISLDEFLQLPETKPASEYIDGKIIQKPMPQAKHSRIQGELVSTINFFTKTTKKALAFPELRCSFVGRAIVPDVVVLKYENIPHDDEGNLQNVVNQAPDWTIEILSSEQQIMKVTNNILHCLNHGCALGWLIDPESKTILIFQSQKQPIFMENEEDLLILPEFLSELMLTLGDIFGWLKI